MRTPFVHPDCGDRQALRLCFLALIGYDVEHTQASTNLYNLILERGEKNPAVEKPPNWWFIGDNLELMARTQKMTGTKRNQLYHFFHIIASRDVFSADFLPNNFALGDMRKDWKFLDNVTSKPFLDDLKKTYAMLLGQMLVLRLDFMKKGGKYDCSSFITATREHKYSSAPEMKQKTKEVPQPCETV